MSANEQIIVVPRAWLFAGEGCFQGVEMRTERILALLERVNTGMSIGVRGAAAKDGTPGWGMEADPTFKQPIPYVVLRRGDQVFVYRRLHGGESRLTGRLSIGVGGHMNRMTGKTFPSEVAENMGRELAEELTITGVPANALPLTQIGLINDDTNPVGEVHLGLLVVADIPLSGDVAVRETESLEGCWTSLTDLKLPETYDRLESWSQMAVAALSR